MAKGKWGRTMMNVIEINGYRAIVQYDPDIDMFRGEFIGLNGGADFYAKDIDSLRREGELSLKVFLDMCKEDGVEPRKEYSGKFNLRVSPQLHAEIATRALAEGKSLNQWVADVLDESVYAH
jgi:predicted HicB family RNase H-like nuclease